MAAHWSQPFGPTLVLANPPTKSAPDPNIDSPSATTAAASRWLTLEHVCRRAPPTPLQPRMSSGWPHQQLGPMETMKEPQNGLYERIPRMRNAAKLDGAEKDLRVLRTRQPTPIKCRTPPTSIKDLAHSFATFKLTILLPPLSPPRRGGQESAQLLEIALRQAATSMSHPVRSTPLAPRGSDPSPCSSTSP